MKLVSAFIRLALVAFVALGGPLQAAKRRSKSKAKSKSAPMKLVEGAPIEHPEALASFFESLRNAEEGKGVARVLQFGDSHTAADYWSGEIRRRLQARFGDGGPGLIVGGRPWRGYRHAGVQVVSGTLWPAQSLREKECDGFVGLAGASLTLPMGESFRVQGAFGELRLYLYGPREEAPRLSNAVVPDSSALPQHPEVWPTLVEIERQAIGTAGVLTIHRAVFEAGARERDAEIRLPWADRFLGVELRSGKPGVIYDELGLNGAELWDLEKWNPALRGALLKQAQASLLVLAYGTNECGRKLSDLEDYRNRVKALIRTLHEESGAPILIIGPLDRLGTKKRARAGLAAGAEKVISDLRAAARSEGAAFWDARKAMGGPGSIQEWKRRGQGQKDLVHLNGAGYQRLGDLLVEALFAAGSLK